VVERNVIKKKTLDVHKIEAALKRFEESFSPEMSLKEFIATNLERLEKFKGKMKELHEFLISNGFDVGTCNSFKETFRYVKRRKRGMEYKRQGN